MVIDQEIKDETTCCTGVLHTSGYSSIRKITNDVKNAVAESASKLAAAEQELVALTSQRSEGYFSALLDNTLTRKIDSFLPVFAEAEAKVAAAKQRWREMHS